jgi:hypothetical protein
VAYVALLDASVLHPWVIRDILLRLAERGLSRTAWSTEILDEVVDSLTERKPEHAERFQRRRERMEAALPKPWRGRRKGPSLPSRRKSMLVIGTSAPRRSPPVPTSS